MKVGELSHRPLVILYLNNFIQTHHASLIKGHWKTFHQIFKVALKIMNISVNIAESEKVIMINFLFTIVVIIILLV